MFPLPYAVHGAACAAQAVSQSPSEDDEYYEEEEKPKVGYVVWMAGGRFNDKAKEERE